LPIMASSTSKTQVVSASESPKPKASVQAIATLDTTASKAVAAVRPALLLAFLAFRFRALVKNPGSELQIGLPIVAAIQVVYAVVCLPAAGSQQAKPARKTRPGERKKQESTGPNLVVVRLPFFATSTPDRRCFRDSNTSLFLDVGFVARPHSHRHWRHTHCLRALRRPLPRPHPTYTPLRGPLRAHRPLPHILRTRCRRPGPSCSRRCVRATRRDIWWTVRRSSWRVARGCTDSARLGPGLAGVARHHRHGHVHRTQHWRAGHWVAFLWQEPRPYFIIDG
jgi:hypothetical protein